ncbi:Holliday junction branch migration protein RuvA [Thiothrix litoralis]|jgi:Holliday junction DNA helicase RuvA|uniref:Holliday junction branch migration complex subunit RuvA n=1 Tax=Thiothrix litoralis TaxID=2891210 RepID=A0ABX7WU46_9GAMM|nr:Holliday junction branch migration protein RuvA [Thiothrix litoralis]QTR45179.1 Holliday junction branch migration protein RuvA [Thiothrix litoralis]
MIGLLRGKLLIKQPPDLMLDVNGVGYEVQASMTTFYDLPELHAEVTLYTHFVVREDAQLLYGFSSQTERELFRHLLKVNGVGPKMALAIVSGMNPIEFNQVIHAADIARLSRIPGVGKKTAERLIIELRDRLPKSDASGSNVDTSIAVQAPRVSASDEAVNALLALGYKPAQASQMIAAYEDQGLSVEDMIRQALRASLK